MKYFLGVQKKRKRGTYRAVGPKELYEACTALVKGQGTLCICITIKNKRSLIIFVHSSR